MPATRLLAILLVALVPVTSHAQGPAPRATPAETTAPGITIVPPGNNDQDQWVIPRYANGKTHPAGALVGWGPMSVVRGNAETEKQDVPAIVVTEDYDQPIGQWQATSGLESVVQPFLRDLTIAGYDFTGDGYRTRGQVGDDGQGPAAAGGDPDIYDGLRWKASGGTVENVNFFGIPGTAATFTRGGGIKNAGLLPFDNEKLKLWGCNAARCYRGFDINVIDAVVGRLSGHSLRDYGVKFSAGATQIDGALHFWGGEKAVWFAKTAGPCWATAPIYAESSAEGLVIDSSGNDFVMVYSHGCSKYGVNISGQDNRIRGLRVSWFGKAAQPVALRIGGQYNTVEGLRIDVPPNSVGVSIVNGTGVKLAGRIGCWEAGKAIDFECGAQPLNFATIDVHIDGGLLGLDLVDDVGRSRLGIRNTIQLTTSTWNPPKEIVELPAKWDASNTIIINGVARKPKR